MRYTVKYTSHRAGGGGDFDQVQAENAGKEVWHDGRQTEQPEKTGQRTGAEQPERTNRQTGAARETKAPSGSWAASSVYGSQL